MSRQNRFSWFASQKRQRRRLKSPSRASGRVFALGRRLHIEPLEDRRMLAVFMVDNLNDAGTGSLREAISMANSAPGADEIQFSVAGAIGLTSGELQITDTLTINGPGQEVLTIDAQQNSRIFGINTSGIVGDVTLRDLTLTGGKVTGLGNSGGAIRSTVVSGNLNLERTVLVDNSASNNGGGAYVADGGLNLLQSTVVGNSALNGAGIYGRAGAAQISIFESTISENKTTAGGGGIASRVDVHIESSTINDNEAFNAGGILILGSASLTIESSTISGNQADRNGGGISSAGTNNVTVLNSTITGNRADELGGGLNNQLSSVINLENTIVADNTDVDGSPDIAPGTGTFNIDYSLIGNTAGSGITASTGTGNILNQSADVAPLANNGGPTQTHALLAGSPAIDAGDPAFSSPPDFDQRGAPFVRIFFGGPIDIGAYERQTVADLNLTVDTTLDENDGDFSTGDLSLREAIGLANGSIGTDTITFDPIVFTGGAASLIRLTQGELDLSDGVTIDGTTGTDVVISGDALGDDTTIGGSFITDATNNINITDNSRIFNILAATGDFMLAGMTLTGGVTTADNIEGRGGAIRSSTSDTLVIDQNTISGNRTVGSNALGGGIFTESDITLTQSTVSDNNTSGFSSSGGGIRSIGNVTLINSTVSGNSTTGDRAIGGGIYSFREVTLTNSTVSGNTTMGFIADGGGILSRGAVTLTQSTVSGNSTAGESADGGGIFSLDAVTLTDSTVSGNSTTGDFSDGGGIYTSSGAVTLTGSTVSGNTSADDGGGIRTLYGDVTLNNSTVTGNSAVETGGGVYVRYLPDPYFPIEPPIPTFLIENSIIAGNTAGTAPDLSPDPDSTLTINYSLIGNTMGSAIGPSLGTGNILNQPALLGPLQDNGGPTETHALLASSPAINAGDPAAVAGIGNTPLFDQRGTGFDRVQAGGIDIGALEDQPVVDSADFDSDGDIDGADFLAWQRGFGSSNPTSADGDADNDNDVDGTDLGIWESQFGQPAPLAELSALSAPPSAFSSPPPTLASPPAALQASAVVPVAPANLIDAALAIELLRTGQVAETPALVEESAFAETYTDRAFAAEAIAPAQRFANESDLLDTSFSEVDKAEAAWLADELLEQ